MIGWLTLALSTLLADPTPAGSPAPPRDVWVALAGDVGAAPVEARRFTTMSGYLLQADLAVYVAPQQGAAPSEAALAAVGFDLAATPATKVQRRALGAGCVSIVPLGAGDDGVAQVGEERGAGCFVIAVTAWSEVDGQALPGAAERARGERLAKAGAGLVVGQHAGAFAGVGWKGRVPIVWNLGSLRAPGVSEAGIFRVRLVHGARGLALGEVDMKPVVHDEGKGNVRTPKEKEAVRIAALATERSRAVGGTATLEAAHIVFRPR